MNRTLVLVSALGAGLTMSAGVAQTAGPQAAAPASPSAPAAAVVPQAVPAKIALIEFEQAAAATNEGQRSLQELQKKYEPKKAELQALGQEIQNLTQLSRLLERLESVRDVHTVARESG